MEVKGSVAQSVMVESVAKSMVVYMIVFWYDKMLLYVIFPHFFIFVHFHE